MPDINAVLVAVKEAVSDLIAAAEQAGSSWSTPRAPGKWSPSQVVEHVARALEESANVAVGAPSKFPNFPFFLRPIARAALFNRVLKTQAFPKARTNRALNPMSGPATPAEGRVRLEAALVRFDQACREVAASGRKVNSTTFGSVSVEDYARFQELHVRHHRKQISQLR